MMSTTTLVATGTTAIAAGRRKSTKSRTGKLLSVHPLFACGFVGIEKS